eukprot:Hpha_TRINITY_DN15964_c1_g4::TRINITY_DN15964_c1_g4_i1::g.73477::m.73477
MASLASRFAELAVMNSGIVTVSPHDDSLDVLNISAKVFPQLDGDTGSVSAMQCVVVAVGILLLSEHFGDQIPRLVAGLAVCLLLLPHVQAVTGMVFVVAYCCSISTPDKDQSNLGARDV